MSSHERISTNAYAVAALLATGVLAGCSTVSDQRIVPEEFAPPGTPVEVRVQLDRAGPVAFYDHTEGGFIEGAAHAGIVGLLLLPVALIVDSGIAASNAARETRARQIAESVGGILESVDLEQRLVDDLRATLDWVATLQRECTIASPPPGCAAAIGPQQPPPASMPAPLVLTVAPTYALPPDANALLVEFRLSFCRAESVFPGKMCADDRPLEARLYVHSDSLPASVEDVTVAVGMWTEDNGARLKDAFVDTTRILAQALLAMREHPGPPARNEMSVTRAVFPYLYDRDLPARDLDVVVVEPDGRRLLRSRIEPMRSGGAGDDQAANVWFSVPASSDGDRTPEKTLIEFMYRRPAEPLYGSP